MKIAIVGAGVMGRLIALSCLKKNYEVTVFDKDDLITPASAAFVSAGMLCPLGEIIHAPQPVVDMGWQSLDLWPAILDTVSTYDPEHESVFFQQEGSLALALPQDRSCFTQLIQDLTLKVQTPDAFKQLNKDEVTQLEPGLSQFDNGVLLKSEGQLCNRTFLKATARILEKNTLINADTTVAPEHFNHLKQTYDWVFDCRGNGAIEQPINDEQKTLRGIRGEVLRVQCNDVKLSRPLRILHPRNSIYIVPKPNSEFVVGATEVESHSQAPVTVKSTLELLSTLYCVHPAFAEASLLEAKVGIRTAFVDNIPKASPTANLITVNGCYRHGWLVGPALAQQAIKFMGSV